MNIDARYRGSAQMPNINFATKTARLARKQGCHDLQTDAGKLAEPIRIFQHGQLTGSPQPKIPRLNSPFDPDMRRTVSQAHHQG